jgi:predicted nucleic acid-binding Zn ribbon protein
MPTGISKQSYHRICIICGSPFETNSWKKMICSYECRKKSMVVINKRNREKNRIAKKVIPIPIRLSTCPKCRKKHKGTEIWEYCQKHEYLRHETFYGEIQHTAHA